MYSKQQHECILENFRTAVQASYGARTVSEGIGRKYPTFMRELSPYDKNAKLGFLDAIAIIRFVNDEDLVKVIEQELGVKIEVLR